MLEIIALFQRESAGEEEEEEEEEEEADKEENEVAKEKGKVPLRCLN